MNDAISFEVTTDLSVINPQKIETNFEAVKSWLTEVLEPYNSMVVTSDDIAGAKTDRATVRKISDAISQQRKAVKEQWNRPLLEFEAQCKELEGMCKDTATAIDTQVKAIEQAEKDTKLSTIKDAFDSITGDIKAYVKWDSVLNPRWGNKGYKLEDAIKEVETYVSLIRADLDAIRSLNSNDEATLLLQYAQTHDIREVLRYAKALEETREAEERRRILEIQRITEAEETRQDSDKRPAAVISTPSAIRPCVDEDDAKPKPKLYELRFSVNVTVEQANKLKAFLTDNGIKYTRINKIKEDNT